MRHIKYLSLKTVTIELATTLQEKAGKNNINLITAKIAYACGAIGYFKKVKLIDFYSSLIEELRGSGGWSEEGKICAKIEDIGGLVYCPKKL